MRYELWKHEGEEVIEQAFFAHDENYQLRPELSDKNFHLVWNADAETYVEAMQKYHEYMGWEPYKPLAE